MAASRNIHVTRAQNHLATDGAFRGALVARGLVHVRRERGERPPTPGRPARSWRITGTLAGFRLGRGYTDSGSARRRSARRRSLERRPASSAHSAFSSETIPATAPPLAVSSPPGCWVPVRRALPAAIGVSCDRGGRHDALASRADRRGPGGDPGLDSDDGRLISGLATAGYLTGAWSPIVLVGVPRRRGPGPHHAAGRRSPTDIDLLGITHLAELYDEAAARARRR